MEAEFNWEVVNENEYISFDQFPVYEKNFVVDFEFEPIQDDLQQTSSKTLRNMEIETSREISQQSTQIFSGEEEEKVENHSKDCLKFCRKISTVIVEYLTLDVEIVKTIFGFNAEILKGLAENLGLDAPSPKELIDLQTNILHSHWLKFKEKMLYSKNKKIGIVQQDQWDLIFCKTVATKSLKEECKSQSKTWPTQGGKELLLEPVFCELLASMLFCMSKLLVIIVILTDDSEKGVFLRNLSNIDTMLVLILFPEMLKSYNHRSGKFAKECCGKCKVCFSKKIPRDFLEQLRLARLKTEFITSTLTKIFSRVQLGSFELAISLTEFAYSQFV